MGLSGFHNPEGPSILPVWNWVPKTIIKDGPLGPYSIMVQFVSTCSAVYTLALKYVNQFFKARVYTS